MVEKEGGFRGGKSLAIVVGGAAAVGLGLIFLKCMKSFGKKDDEIWLVFSTSCLHLIK